ncbi:trimeric intracellular cation channel family protein [Tomitella fengzijianii]|uniref:Trimeric intracellular cation channel family protein n=1 Tax=Tomitella fengzijianii TaxID=2597660 RepID=A0A516X1R9_9ACTN|nr:trimeric intracellular cation channel family protein [Tomitella fengzijianii]QDQ97032.1 trimeric intracellular cation channel family protein [Tomitella fengzijianii]
MLTTLDLIGTAAFAASGASIGVYKRLDLFGVCVVGVTTGIGGGITRDLLLGVHPPTALDRWPNFVVALAFSLAVFLLHPLMGHVQSVVLWLDALGMGVFATTGAATALHHDAEWWAAILIGAITAIGGGVLRDVLVNEMPLLLHRDLYATPALLGALIVVAFELWSVPYPWGLVAGTVIATALRMAALTRGWNLPSPPQWGRTS